MKHCGRIIISMFFLLVILSDSYSYVDAEHVTSNRTIGQVGFFDKYESTNNPVPIPPSGITKENSFGKDNLLYSDKLPSLSDSNGIYFLFCGIIIWVIAIMELQLILKKRGLNK